MALIEKRRLLNPKDGQVYTWNRVLAQRTDLVPCDQDGNPDRSAPKDIGQPEVEDVRPKVEPEEVVGEEVPEVPEEVGEEEEEEEEIPDIDADVE